MRLINLMPGFAALSLLISCFNSDIYVSAESSLSNLDYTVEFSNGTLEGDVLTVPVARYNVDQEYINSHPDQFDANSTPQPYPVYYEGQVTGITITNPNADSFEITDIYFENPDPNHTRLFISEWNGKTEVKGGESFTANIRFLPYTRESVSDTLVIKTNWSPERRFTVTGSGVEPGIYISPEGSDETGDGSPNYPFYTINKAIETAQDGEIIRAAAGEYNYSKTQLIEKAGIKIFGSHSNDGKWIMPEEAQDSIIRSTVSDPDSATIKFSGSQISFDNRLTGFKIFGTSSAVNSSSVVLVDGGSPAIYGNYLTGSTASTNAFGALIINDANPIFAFNAIFATPESFDGTKPQFSAAVNASHTGGTSSIILNQIFGGNAANESVGIFLNLTGSASADVYSNSIYSGSSNAGHTIGVYAEGRPGSSVFIINNTIITGISLNPGKGVFNETTNERLYIINNLFSTPMGNTVTVTGVEDNTSKSVYIRNNFFDSQTITYPYHSTSSTDFASIAFSSEAPATGDFSNNFFTDPGFTSYDNFVLDSSSNTNVRTGGIDLQSNSLITDTLAYKPFWTKYFGFSDLAGKHRTGNNLTGYSIGGFEID